MTKQKLKIIDIDYYLIFDISKEPKFYDADNQEMISYWTDNKKVYWRTSIIKNADIETFTVFNSIFAKDKKHCYLQSHALKGANPEIFTALNNCFAKDDTNAWTTGGCIKDIDVETFQVCDEGINKPIIISDNEFKDGIKRKVQTKIPYGYAKDKNNVFYENFQGKIKILKKASSDSFESLNNGSYGFDRNFVFYQQYIIQKANPKTWFIIDFDKNSCYSKDDKYVFYCNKIIKGADAETFELCEVKGENGYIEYFGKDKDNYYNKLDVSTAEELDMIVNQ